ncbi:MAG: hypothetical protein IT509_03645 [Rhodocyclaceae bacterium]|nr:hypothetical protein [Rhodocyclaceae bacterium]
MKITFECAEALLHRKVAGRPGRRRLRWATNVLEKLGGAPVIKRIRLPS